MQQLWGWSRGLVHAEGQYKDLAATEQALLRWDIAVVQGRIQSPTRKPNKPPTHRCRCELEAVSTLKRTQRLAELQWHRKTSTSCAQVHLRAEGWTLPPILPLWSPVPTCCSLCAPLSAMALQSLLSLCSISKAVLPKQPWASNPANWCIWERLFFPAQSTKSCRAGAPNTTAPSVYACKYVCDTLQEKQPAFYSFKANFLLFNPSFPLTNAVPLVLATDLCPCLKILPQISFATLSQDSHIHSLSLLSWDLCCILNYLSLSTWFSMHDPFLLVAWTPSKFLVCLSILRCPVLYATCQVILKLEQHREGLSPL